MGAVKIFCEEVFRGCESRSDRPAMLARHILTFLFALLFAACDAQSLFIHAGTTPGRKYENQEPQGPGSITCCRCSSAGCKSMSVSGPACPPGWEPEGPPQQPE